MEMKRNLYQLTVILNSPYWDLSK